MVINGGAIIAADISYTNTTNIMPSTSIAQSHLVAQSFTKLFVQLSWTVFSSCIYGFITLFFISCLLFLPLYCLVHAEIDLLLFCLVTFFLSNLLWVINIKQINGQGDMDIMPENLSFHVFLMFL